jgi:hypothetical protein
MNSISETPPWEGGVEAGSEVTPHVTFVATSENTYLTKTESRVCPNCGGTGRSLV